MSSNTNRRAIAIALINLLLASLLNAQTPAQQPQNPQSGTQLQTAAPPRPGEFKFAVSTDIVLVNVVARDGKGNPVSDLKMQDFTLLEDGKAQHLASFDSENLDTTPVSPAVGPSQETINGAPAPPSKPLLTRKDAEEALNHKRVIVLFFDLTSMQPDEMPRAVDAATQYVQKKMTSADMIAIVSLGSSLRLDQDFTGDQAQLLKVLKRFTESEGEGMDNGATGSSDIVEENGDAYTPDQTEYNQFNTDRKLQALQSVCQVLGKFNQKKSMIYFSSGMTQTGIENEAALRAAINTAVRGNVAIYTMDARGLQAFPPGGTASTGSLRGNVMYTGAGVQNQYDQNFASQETLVTLADDTGGKAFLDSNDLGQVFDRVQRDTSVYYVLGYKSNNILRDGRYRHIQVKINRPGIKLEFRKGYYAPKDYKHFNNEDKEQQLQDEMTAELPSTDLAVYMAAAYFRLDESRFYIPVSIVVPGSQIPFTKGGDKDKATLDIIGGVQDELKRPISSVRQTVKLALDSAQQVQHKNVQYSTGFILPAGKYHFKFVLRENEGGKIGSFETDFVVPDIRKAPLKMSSVVLASQTQQNSKKGQNPLVHDGTELIPNIAHVFTPDQHLYLFYEVYDPAKEKEKEKAAAPGEAKDKTAEVKNPIHLLTSIQFFSGKIKMFETSVVEARQLNAPERKAAVFQFDVPLAQLKPGLYTCQVNVIDDAGGTFSFPRMPILVREKPAAPAQTATTGGN